MSGFNGNTSFGFGSGGGTSGGGTSIVTSGKICSIASGTSIIDTIPVLGYNSAFINYSLYDCTNYVAGQLTIVWNPTTGQFQFNNVTTNDVGSTAGASLSVSIIGNSVNIIATVPNANWKYSYYKVVNADCCTVPIDSALFITTENGLDLTTELGEFLVT